MSIHEQSNTMHWIVHALEQLILFRIDNVVEKPSFEGDHIKAQKENDRIKLKQNTPTSGELMISFQVRQTRLTLRHMSMNGKRQSM